MFNEVITLLGDKTELIDEYGDLVTTYKETDVFGRMDRVYLSETLQAMAQGIERQYRFRLTDYYDYDNQELLVYEGNRYRIINTQRIGKELEINCIGGVEDGKS